MRTSTILAAAGAALASVAVAGEARAEAPGEVRLYAENDFFNWFTDGTDRFYTQGIRLEGLYRSSKSDAHFLPGITHDEWCSLLCGAGADSGEVNTGYAIGQNMYTPQDITIAEPQPFDRPWAGLLYASRIARKTYLDRTLNLTRQDRIELALGIVGPASFAKQVQIWWHDDVIHDPDHPSGWDNQLRNEPIVQLRYETAARQRLGDHADVIPRVRGNLGNALVSLEGEVTGRIGWNLSGFGVPSIEPLVETRRLGGNVFVRLGINAVAHNIFLDGNSFADNDIRIDRKPLVPEMAAGVELNLIPRVTVTYQFIARGSEFRSPRDGDAPWQEFGALTVAYRVGH